MSINPNIIVPSPFRHPDQTTKQPVVWRCPNPECFESNLSRYYEFESEYGECPKCGLKEPYVRKRVLIHVLVRDKGGPIVGNLGLRYRLACDPKRVTLATATNGEAATGDVTTANCPGCLKAIGDKLKQTGQNLSFGS